MSNPQDPNETPRPTPPSAPPGRYISSRLREKLEAAQSEPETPIGGGGPPWGGIIGAVIVIALAIGGFMWWRGSHAKHETAATPASADSAATAAADTTAHTDSTAMAAASPSPSPSPVATAHGAASASKPAGTVTKPAASTAAQAETPAKPKEKPAATASSGESAPAPPKAGKAPFGVSVASFMFEDKANESRDALAASTGLPAIVMPRDEGGTTMYHVVLGSFPTRTAAEKKATELLTSAGVHEAQVVSRPK